MVWRLILGGVAAAWLSACAAQPTPYKPQDGAFGYAETQLDAQTWRVEFAGNADTPRQTVENYLLYRCAEVMLFGGYERFIILEKEVEQTREYRSFGPPPYDHFGAYHGIGWHRRWPPYGPYYGYGSYHTYTLTYYTAIATIRTFTDEVAPAGLQVYRARDVIAQLAPTVVPPP